MKPACFPIPTCFLEDIGNRALSYGFTHGGHFDIDSVPTEKRGLDTTYLRGERRACPLGKGGGPVCTAIAEIRDESFNKGIIIKQMFLTLEDAEAFRGYLRARKVEM